MVLSAFPNQPPDPTDPVLTKIELYYLQTGTPPAGYAVTSAQDWLIDLIGVHTKFSDEFAPAGGLAFGYDRGPWAEHILIAVDEGGETPEFALEWCGRFRREKRLSSHRE